MDMSLLERLCLAYGVSGNEGDVRELILAEIKGYVDECRVDSIGNVIAFKKGLQPSKVKLMLSCHMDEVGFIVTSITDEGFLRINPVGGIDASVACGTQVVVGDNHVTGIIGTKPIHLLEQSETEKRIKFTDISVDIGANTKDEAEQHIHVGDYATFDSDFVLRDGVIRSKALDDRVGCYALIEMIKGDIPVDVHFVFAVQEEVGLRGAKVAAYEVNPDAAIVVEATTAADICGVKDDDKVCSLENGVAVSFMDKGTIYDREYYDTVMKIGQNLGIKVQPKKAVTGGNDAGVIHSTRAGVRTIALSVPCRYLHSGACQIAQCDLVSLMEMLKNASQEIALDGGWLH